MLSPLPWRRPWKLASQVATVDHISAGRVILSVGLGWADSGIGDRRDVIERKTRADLLDEGVEVMDCLWRGELTRPGQRYFLDIAPGHVQDLRPVQDPRPPVWVVAAWHRPKSMARVLRCDGVLPVAFGAAGTRPLTPADIAALRRWISHRTERLIDIVVEGQTPTNPSDGAAIVHPWVMAGATWWVDAR
jgi:alkanesulfonate monooxygenase SsuD/methylene tetrahydromethanopterin reductase-like flavin-dependent oxidoreductase (luciferase family)